MAFHSLDYPLEFGNIGKPFLRGHLAVAPVIDHRTYHNHHAARPGPVVFGVEIHPLECVQHCSYGVACLTLVAVHKKLQGFQLHLRSDTTHLEIVAEIFQFHSCLFLITAGHGSLAELLEYCFAHRMFHFLLQVWNIFCADIQTRMLEWRNGNSDSVKFGPYGCFGIPFDWEPFFHIVF